ncbi:hypothetical protein ACIBI4_13190 [Streptomyces sp. NPDC050418]|uniref:hypothetical protein n=1 Tax=Streptomyces sp. NPDC050418 TaxID=3365612 RepID=UPI0037898F37
MREFAETADEINSLTALDFDPANVDADGEERLYTLCEELYRFGPGLAAPLMFALMERLDGADLGDPGPLVHTLERWPGEYEVHLRDSINRKPSLLAVWMVNRLINVSEGGVRDNWIHLLREALDNPATTLSAKREVLEVLKFQSIEDSSG